MYGKLDEGTAYQWLQKAEQAALDEGNPLHCNWVYYAMGIIYHHQGQREKMYEAFYKALAFAERSPVTHTGVFDALSANLMDDKRYDEQLDIERRFVKLRERNKDNDRLKAMAYANLATALERYPGKKQEYDYYLKKAVAIWDTISISPSDNRLQVASINYKLKRMDNALKYCNIILATPETDNEVIAEKGLTYRFLSEIYEKQCDFAKSLSYLKQFYAYEIKLQQGRLTEDAGRKVIKAESEKALALKETEIEKQKSYMIFTASGALFILVLVAIVYYYYRREQQRKQELSQLNATKDKLFAILSHDLMSPIANFKNILMLTDWGMMTQSEFNQIVKDMSQKASNLHSMFENVLHWAISQMQGIRPKQQKTAVNELLSEQIQLVSPIAKSKQIDITLVTHQNGDIYIDKNHLALILRNILQNALKFTHQKGCISIDIDIKTHAGSPNHSAWLSIAVSDNGVGMSADVLNQLFKGGQSSQKGTAQETGTGLGLVLTKELVELNGGQIHVDSSLGRGTQVELRFPIAD